MQGSGSHHSCIESNSADAVSQHSTTTGPVTDYFNVHSLCPDRQDMLVDQLEGSIGINRLP